MKNRTELDSGCFVVGPDALELNERGNLRWQQVMGVDDAARMLSLFCVEVGSGVSEGIRAGAGEAVLYLLQGDCRLDIGGREFAAAAGSGAHVRRGETFRFVHAAGEPARWLIGICPRVEGLDWAANPDGRFDDDYPDRLVAAAGRDRQATGDRHYKLLVGPHNGSREVTQFIGMIPRSRAPEHFHLYEEAICILRGTGRLWTGERSAAVGPGSMIFLPRQQPHSLECTCDEGLELVGLFYPAGSPALNYPAG